MLSFRLCLRPFSKNYFGFALLFLGIQAPLHIATIFGFLLFKVHFIAIRIKGGFECCRFYLFWIK
jgi:hypothetical protein